MILNEIKRLSLNENHHYIHEQATTYQDNNPLWFQKDNKLDPSNCSNNKKLTSYSECKNTQNFPTITYNKPSSLDILSKPHTNHGDAIKYFFQHERNLKIESDKKIKQITETDRQTCD